MQLLTLKNVLVATDLHEGSRAALTCGRELAEAAGAALHVVHVSDERGAVEAVSAMLQNTGMPPGGASVHVVQGDPARAINTLADTIGADAILAGPHRQRREVEGERDLGSTALALVTQLSVPCMVVAAPPRLPLRRVVAAVDMSGSARGTLVVALSWASALRVPRGIPEPTVLTALHVQRSAAPSNGRSAAARSLDEMLEHLRHEAGAWAGAVIESAIADGADPSTVIAEFTTAHGADMVVLGTRASPLENVDRLGSVAAAVTRHLKTPVLLVPPSIWMSYASEPPRAISASP